MAETGKRGTRVELSSDGVCPDCAPGRVPQGAESVVGPEDGRDVPRDLGIDRREFLRTVGVTAAGAATLSVGGAGLAAAPEKKPAETFVQLLFESLSAEQKKAICFPFDHPLRLKVANNWHIVDETIGQFFNSDQQELIREILRGITTEDGYERFQRSMKDDSGGLGEYSCAIFGAPGAAKFEWVLTGRHVTLRADGNSVDHAAFGGPIFYGHAVKFTEEPDHPGNVWWHQGRLANEVFGALEGKQRARALLADTPADTQDSVALRGAEAEIPGLRASELTKDQKELLEKTLKSLLRMFRESDVDEVLDCIKKNGGTESLRIAFYRSGDLGSDKVWDRWRIEGPTFVWHFRGSPHVHTWVNVRDRV